MGEWLVRYVWDIENVSSSLAYPTKRRKFVMKKRKKKNEDYEMIKKFYSFMDFATRLKMAQEAKKKKK